MVMKNLTFSSLLLLLAFGCVTAQDSYRSVFGKEQTSWSTKMTDMPGDFVDSLAVIGDTLIGGLRYWSLMHYEIVDGIALSDESAVSLLREDTASGRLWYHNSDYGEILVQNMQLTVEDSFRIPFTGGTLLGDYRPVHNIYMDNENRKVIEIAFTTGMGQPYTMIEGVGPNVGFRYMYGPGIESVNASVLLCQHKDGETFYVNDHPVYSGQCGLLGTGVPQASVSESMNLTVFPNPVLAGHAVNVKWIQDVEVVWVTDFIGRIVMRTFVNGKTKCSFFLMNPGFYMLHADNRTPQKLIVH